MSEEAAGPAPDAPPPLTPADAVAVPTWRAAYSDRTATLVCDDGNDNIVNTQHIEFTDFPRDEITLWFANSVIYLPREH